MRYSFYYPPENKVLVARNAEFLENSLIDQEASGSLEDLEIIHEEYMHPYLDTSLNHEEDDLEIDEPQSDIVLIRRSTRTRHAPDRMCLYIDAEEHELGDLDEPANYKPALLDQESVKWLNAMNVEMQSMKENEEKLKLSKSQGASTLAEMKRMQNVPYASAVGSIMYDVRYTRPNVAFAQNVTSRFQQNPDADDLKSQNGYVFVLNGGAVDWKSAKQSIFATSSAEAKYIAAFDASKEAVWVRKFIFGLSVVPII
nr:putative retrotransposon protein [Tanacetum cinerariifolium]